MTRPRLALLVNCESRRHRRRLHPSFETLAREADVALRLRRPGEDVTPWLAELLAHEVRLLAIDGGDGTIMRTLSALAQLAPAAAWPPLALLPGGSTNLTHACLGLPRQGGGTLWRLLAFAREEPTGLTLRDQRVPRLEGGGLTRPLYGFLFGAAGVCDLVRRWQRRLRARGLVGTGSHLLLALGVLPGLLAGRPALAGLGARTCRIRVDEADWGERERLIILASALPQLVLGLRPWWHRGEQPLAVTAIPPRSPRWRRTALRLLRGEGPPPAPLPPGWASSGGCRATFEGLAEFVLDGDLFAADPGEPLVIGCEERIRLVCDGTAG